MQKVTVKKVDLLEKVKQNREEHLAEYKEAKEKMVEEIRNYHEQQLLVINSGSIEFDTNYNFLEPENHEKDYDQVITMLEMSTEEVIELTNHEFAQYVMDEWGWKDAFKMINSTYLSK